MNMETAFRDLHRAALAMGTVLMADAPAEKLPAIEAALNGGARLILEIGALPDPDRVLLVLVEKEGRRHTVVGITAAHGVLQ